MNYRGFNPDQQQRMAAHRIAWWGAELSDESVNLLSFDEMHDDDEIVVVVRMRRPS